MRGQFDVVFNADQFPAAVSRRGVLKCTGGDLAHALFVTGRAPGDRMAHGLSSVWEWIHRVSLIPAYVRQDAAGGLLRSTLAESLDRSEKIAGSYALGQALTGIFCQQRLNVTHLMHVDRYASRWNVVFGAGRSRPDLIGMTLSGEWVVAEAKGRSNSIEPGLARKLHNQKGMIREVDGRPPHVSLGCVASFPVLREGQHGPLRVDAVDPEPSEEAISLEIDPGRFARTYYEPFEAAIAMGQRSDLSSDDVVVVDLPAIRLSVGLRRDLLGRLASTDGFRQDWKAIEPDKARASVADGTQVRLDGTFVRASWLDEFGQQDIEKA